MKASLNNLRAKVLQNSTGKTYKNKIDSAKNWVLSKYPKAINLTVGSNNMCTGIWFELPNATRRQFKPLFD